MAEDRGANAESPQPTTQDNEADTPFEPDTRGWIPPRGWCRGFGRGGGQGMGRGGGYGPGGAQGLARGGGGGLGRGRQFRGGMGPGTWAGPPGNAPALTRAQLLQVLRQQVDHFRATLEEITQRIDELESADGDE